MKYLFLILFSSSVVFAGQFDTNILLRFSDAKNAANYKYVECGINELAGDSIDTHLGEESLPFPFSGTFGVYFTFIDSITHQLPYPDRIWTYKDFRGVNSDIAWMQKYNIVMTTGPVLEIRIDWNSTKFSKYIDSIRIMDGYGGDVFNVDMLKENHLIITKNFLEKVDIIVYYNKIPSNIEELNVSNDYIIYPNIVYDNLNINNNDYDMIRVYDVLGNIVVDSKNLNDILKLSSGCYFVEVIANNKIVSHQRINKI